MSVQENISAYFKRKVSGEATQSNPKGTCPNCWGRNEWDGQFYEIIKDKHAKPGSAIYDSFISEAVNNHVAKTHNLKDQYICITCNAEILT